MLEPTADWLMYVLDTMDEGIHVVDGHGVTVVYNRAASRLDGVSAKDVLGKHVLSVFPSLGQETSTLLQVLKTGVAMNNQPQTYTNYMGAKVHTVNTTLPILSGKQVIGALEIAKDLTQVKHLSDQVLALQERVIGAKNKKAGANAKGSSVNDSSFGAAYHFSDILTRDEAMQTLLRRAERAAKTTSPILVYGETGTGKELLVQAIHNASTRSNNPFLAINCAALPSALLEGILFGTVRGSFTGAEDRPGLFELADGGTLFMDEIQSLPMELQAKLLRVLQEGEFFRVGDTRRKHTSARIIAAMNILPEHALEQMTLRRDLYYRINVVRFDIPPLRARAADIPLLVENFIDKWNLKFSTYVEGLAEPVKQLFAVYPWPGNVRELENAIEGALNLVDEGEVQMDALPYLLREWHNRQQSASASFQDNPSSRSGFEISAQFNAGNQAHAEKLPLAQRDLTSMIPLNQPDHPYLPWADALVTEGMNEFWLSLETPPTPSAMVPKFSAMQEAFERMILTRTLQLMRGNVKQSAERLNIPRQTLQYRLKQLSIAP